MLDPRELEEFPWLPEVDARLPAADELESLPVLVEPPAELFPVLAVEAADGPVPAELLPEAASLDVPWLALALVVMNPVAEMELWVVNAWQPEQSPYPPPSGSQTLIPEDPSGQVQATVTPATQTGPAASNISPAVASTFGLLFDVEQAAARRSTKEPAPRALTRG